MSPVRLALVILFATALSGCSSAEPKLGEVTGAVTFNGLPAHAELTFEPQSVGNKGGGRVSSCYTSADGTYRLQYSEERTGAVIGEHLVTIRVLRPDTKDSVRTFDEATVPLKLLRLKRTVSAGRNEMNFATVL